eukprot:XP_024998798.1 extensin-like [Gallus gallus]
MGLGDFPWDNGASNWGLSPPRAARAGACSTEPSLGFRVNTGMHHLYGQGEERRLSWGGCMRQPLCIQPPLHCTGLGGGGGVLQGGFSQPCRASAAVPSTGIPHSCFLPPNLTGTSGGAGSSPPPTPPQLLPALPSTPPVLATVLTAAPKANRSPPGSRFPSKMPTLGLTPLQPSHLPSASPGGFYCPHPSPILHPFGAPCCHMGAEPNGAQHAVCPPTHPDAAPHGGPAVLWHIGKSRTPPSPPGHRYPHLSASSNHTHHPLGAPTTQHSFTPPPPPASHGSLLFLLPIIPHCNSGGGRGGAGALSRVCRCGVRTWVTHRPRCHPPPTISSQGGVCVFGGAPPAPQPPHPHACGALRLRVGKPRQRGGHDQGVGSSGGAQFAPPTPPPRSAPTFLPPDPTQPQDVASPRSTHRHP